jgi:tetratricopeptide (TPR) repeat protein
VKAARQADDRTLLSLYLMLHAYYQYHQSAYRAAYCTAEEGRQLALEVGDAYHYACCQSFQTVALLHLGAWGEMRGLLRDAYQRAEKNGHQLEMIFFQLEIAWLHEQAFDFKRTRALCEQALKHARETGHDKTTPLFLGLILAGFAHLGLKHYEQAFDCFSEIPHRIEREDLVMDWIMQLPLHHGLSQYWLAQGAFERARQEAERLCVLAAQSGERTYLALGRRTLAEIALTEQHWDQAEEDLRRALAVLGETEAPLAAWRVYALAAEFYGKQGRKAEARRYRSHSAAIID